MRLQGDRKRNSLAEFEFAVFAVQLLLLVHMSACKGRTIKTFRNASKQLKLKTLAASSVTPEVNVASYCIP